MVDQGIGRPGKAAHSPDERLSLDHFHRGTEALIRCLVAGLI